MSNPVFTTVGSYTGGSGVGLNTGSLTTSNVGDVILLTTTIVGTNGITVSGISGGNVINWRRVVGPITDPLWISEMWMGTVNAVGTATATITFSASVAALTVYLHSQQFTAGLGASTVWATDGTQVAGADHVTSTTLLYPSLTASAGPRLYYGVAWSAVTNPVAGSTPGFIYAISTDSAKRIAAYNPNASGTLAPTATTGSTGPYVGLAVILTAGLPRRPVYRVDGQLVEIPDGDAFPGGIGGVTPVDIQAFTTTGTWTEPAGVTLVKCICIGAGGGGGSGRRGATSTNRGGGASGGGGAYSIANFPASALSSTETVTVGAGGTAGAAITVDDTDGSPGGNGGDSVFRASNGCTAGGGGGGGGGTTAGGTAGVAGAGHLAGGAGTTGGLPNAVSASAVSSLGASGGGSGMGINTVNSGGPAGSGGANNGSGFSGGVGSSAASTPGGNGTSGPANQPYTGTGGGGGRGAALSTSAAGGNGGTYGGGGGGGSASLDGFTTMAGGTGGAGFVIVYSY